MSSIQQHQELLVPALSCCPAVPLKMIANFKRVKGLTKELSVVTEALKGSSMLSVDEEGSRVRRTTPLPAYDTSDICRRTVVAEHLPDKPTIGELPLVMLVQSTPVVGSPVFVCKGLIHILAAVNSLVCHSQSPVLPLSNLVTLPLCAAPCRVCDAAVCAVRLGGHGAHLQPRQHRQAALLAEQSSGGHQHGCGQRGVCTGGVCH